MGIVEELSIAVSQVVSSWTTALGALALTDSMPFSAEDFCLYLSLDRMTCPLDALRWK